MTQQTMITGNVVTDVDLGIPVWSQQGYVVAGSHSGELVHQVIQGGMLDSTGPLLSRTNADVVNLGVTLEEGLQDTVHDALWQESPLEDSVVGTARADDPLQVIGPANVCHVGRVANVLFEFGSC